jgi:asparagine synthase (glutamine-hydrolysing)
MGQRLTARGPDDSGLWQDPSTGVGLVHRRLAVLDLSPAGHQPMRCANSRYVIAFNGEIYNHLALREALARQGVAPTWQGHSDTETLLAGFVAWGVRETVLRCVGMFAFAVWDQQERQLTLCRDRMGEKPLYYGWSGVPGESSFVFGSELKALMAIHAMPQEIDRDALCLLMRYGYISAPHSIFSGVKKLLPGHLLQIGPGQSSVSLLPYWTLTEVALKGADRPLVAQPPEVLDQLEGLIDQSVRDQMLSDVPLGAFLSGGIDSSAIVALMQKNSSRPVRTFSIGFHEAAFDESTYARAVAKHLGTDHQELIVTPQDALQVIPRLPGIYCEPFADSSQIPTFLVSQMARRDVTVALSGDAGDELFYGYDRYQLAVNVWRAASWGALSWRRALCELVRSISPRAWDQLGRLGLGPRLGDRLHKAARLLGSEHGADVYRNAVSHWEAPEGLVIGGQEPHSAFTTINGMRCSLSLSQQLLVTDLLTYLPDNNLAKLDRASMAVSLETRVPFLDHRLVEFACALPMEFKRRDGQNKWALRQVLYRHVPRDLIDRPKMGFSVPVNDWLRGPLRDWAESLLDESRLKRQGLLRPQVVRKIWEQHLSGRHNWHFRLWNVLMFQAWMAHWQEG